MTLEQFQDFLRQRNAGHIADLIGRYPEDVEPFLDKIAERLGLIPVVKDLFPVNGVVKAGYGSPKRYVIYYRTKDGTKLMAAPLSGGEIAGVKGTIENFQPIPGKPVWTGVKAKKLYDRYVESMTDVGNADLILSFVSAKDRPAIEEEIPDSQPFPDVTITHTAQDGTIAHFEKNDAIYSILRRFGFIWVPTIKKVRRLNSVGQAKTSAALGSIKTALNEAGYRVAFDLQVADTTEANERRREYLTERSEMLADRAERLSAKLEGAARQVEVQAEQAIRKLDIPGYFPTPDAYVEQMIEAADLFPGASVLEPSAGHGAIADAARDAVGRSGVVDVVEVHPQLQALLRQKQYPIVGMDILNFHPGPIYDRIIMNPPFEHGQDAQHVQAAFELLKPGGRLVSIMSKGPFFRNYLADTRFRKWLETVPHEVEELPAAQFGRTQIATNLVTIDKPLDWEVQPINGAALAEIEQARSAVGKVRSVQTPRDFAAQQLAELKQSGNTDRKTQKAIASVERQIAKLNELERYASATESRSRAVARKADRVGVTREKPRTDDYEFKVGDVVQSRQSETRGIVLRIHKHYLEVQNQQTKARERWDPRLVVTVGRAEVEEAPLDQKGLVAALRKRIKKDLPEATLAQSSAEGYTIGFGSVRDHFGRKYTDRDYRVILFTRYGDPSLSIYPPGTGLARRAGYSRPVESGERIDDLAQEVIRRIRETEGI